MSAQTSETPEAELQRLSQENAVLRAVEEEARAVVAEARETHRWSKALRSLFYALNKVGATTNPHLALPAWIFDAQQYAGGPAYFLMAIEPDGGFPSIDGAHGDPAGVATARKLYGSIGLIAPPHGTRYLMLTVQAAPEPGGDVNDEAIATLNGLVR